MPDPAVSERDREKAKEVIESYCGPKRMVWPNQVAVFEDLMLGMRGEIAHALAIQREEDARVARDFMMCCENHNNDEIADAIRRGGEGKEKQE